MVTASVVAIYFGYRVWDLFPSIGVSLLIAMAFGSMAFAFTYKVLSK